VWGKTCGDRHLQTFQARGGGGTRGGPKGLTFRATVLNALEEFESLREESRARWVQDLPNRGLWGGNPVPRAEIRPSYRIMPESPMDKPICQGTFGSTISHDGPAVIEDLRVRDQRGVPERIFTRSD
jgi:hypothetical protein